MTHTSARPVIPPRRTYAIRSPSGDQAGCSSAAPERVVSLVTVNVEGSTVNRSGSPSRSDAKTSTPLLEAKARGCAPASVGASPRSTRTAIEMKLTLRTVPL